MNIHNNQRDARTQEKLQNWAYYDGVGQSIPLAIISKLFLKKINATCRATLGRL